VKAWVFAAITGAIFALGLAVSGMTSPGRVTAFLDVGGGWDPTLAFVMAAAILVHAPIVRLVRDRRQPLFSEKFHWPSQHAIDLRLVLGAALFGVGWGLSGYCPGPAIVGVLGGAPATLVFVGAMAVGIVVTRLATRRRPTAG